MDHLTSKTFCVSFTNDGNSILTASQGFFKFMFRFFFVLDNHIRLYCSQGYNQRYVLKKVVRVPCMGWSILDMAISPDGKHLAYSTWHEGMFQCDINLSNDSWQQLRVKAPEYRLFLDYNLFNKYFYRFALFSLRFNNDGTEIIAGSNEERIYIYNREIGKQVLATHAHDDEINALCFGDRASHIILSGSDDGLCKVKFNKLIS